MSTIAMKLERQRKELRAIDHLIALQAKGNIAPVVAGNPCPRRTQCMAELTAYQLYEGRGRVMVVPHGRNPFN